MVLIPRSHYSPVDSEGGQIRLLILYPPTKQSDAIYCELKPTYLSSNPDYEALSYTWGTVGQASEIRLGNQQFHVRENVAAALRRLRHAKKPRTLWIDAICINQDDLAERGAQVLLMREVFSQASQVCVWLGELGDGGILGMQSLQKKIFSIGWSTWKIDRKWGRPTLSGRKAIQRSAGIMDKSNLDDELMLGEVRELLSRPWWRRTWIVQEAIVASNIVLMCGPETAPWDSIEKLRKLLPWVTDHMQAFGIDIHEKNLYLDAAYQTISDYREKWHSSPSDINILDVLYRFRNLQCEDQKDRIFAFLGIAPSAIEMGIVPDYQSSLTEVYSQFALKVILATKSLDILNCAREWREVKAIPPPEQAYSVLDQSRYYDVNAEITDGLGKKPRRAWARLPSGWERIPKDKESSFLDHETKKTHDTSPLEGHPPTPAEYFTSYRSLSPGWSKKWSNLGCPLVRYQPDETPDDVASRTKREIQQAELSTIPSWVPNWAVPTLWDPALLIDWPQPHKRQYSASGTTQCNLPSPLPSPTGPLPLPGLLFDTISHLAPPWHPTTTIPPISRKGITPLLSWETLATTPVSQDPYSTLPSHHSNPKIPIYSPRHEALFLTLLAIPSHPATPLSESRIYLELWYDRTDWAPSMPDLTSMGILTYSRLEVNLHQSHEDKMYDLFVELSAGEDTTMIQEERDAYYDRGRVSKRYGEIMRRVFRTCAHRALFVTEGGYIGLAPWNAGVGDRVVVLDGGETPFLVRDRGGGGYELVGESYVCGIMGGEAAGMEGVGRRVFDIV